MLLALFDWYKNSSSSGNGIKLLKSPSSKHNNQNRIFEELAVSLIKFGIVVGITTTVLYILVRRSDEKKNKEKKALAARLSRPEILIMEFSEYESKLFSDIIACHEIDVGFKNIGGLNEKLEEIKDNIILPLEMWNILRGKSSLMPCPTGVLLCKILFVTVTTFSVFFLL
jgi:ATP-dependent 26S proteasome regulatory subunit